eukprot:PITA_14112
MEENESVSTFISQIKEVKDKLTDIGENVLNGDLVTITMNGMTNDYQMFITGLNAREKPPGFEELTGILLQEEERRLSLKPQNSNLALMTKWGEVQAEKICKYLADADQNQDVRLFMVETALATEEDESDIWFVDSEASSHMTGKKQWFKNFKESNTRVKVYLVDDRGYEIKGHGDVLVTLPDGNIRNISDVWYVPGIKKNLISVSKITDQDLKVEFFKSYCIIKDLLDQMKPIATGVCIGGLYKLDVKSTPQQALMSSDTSAENLWHQRLGHINFSDLLLL